MRRSVPARNGRRIEMARRSASTSGRPGGGGKRSSRGSAASSRLVPLRRLRAATRRVIPRVCAFLEELCAVPSPTGMCSEALEFVAGRFSTFPAVEAIERPSKEGLLVRLGAGDAGAASSGGPFRLLSAHVDTLGAMVRRIRPDGGLLLQRIGGWQPISVCGEYCVVHTSGGKRIRGTILPDRSSTHAFKDALSAAPRLEDLVVRLDEEVSSAQEAGKLGVRVGDFVSFDSRFERTASGYVKSRHLDDKAGVACLYGAVALLEELSLRPPAGAWLYFSAYEEVGHGAALLPGMVREMVAVDMAVVGGDSQASRETACTVCLMDSSGPYDRELSERLLALGELHGVDVVRDLYPYYGSDGSAALRAGHDVRVALVGPGVDASHAWERTHERALAATVELLALYLCSCAPRAGG